MDNGIMSVNGGLSNFYSSIEPATPDEKKRLFRAMVSPDENLSDYINKKINLVDVFVNNVEMTDEDTGEVTTAQRVVMFDDKGRSYQCVSKGIMQALQALFVLYGEPKTWDTPIEIVIKQVKVKRGTMTTFDVA